MSHNWVKEFTCHKNDGCSQVATEFVMDISVSTGGLGLQIILNLTLQ